MSKSKPDYYVITSGDSKDRCMRLYGVRDPNHVDRWLKGGIFRNPPTEPVKVCVRDTNDNEKMRPMDFYYNVPVMSVAFYDMLQKANIDNIHVYPAVIKSADKTVHLTNYYAYNILGHILAADPLQSVYNPDNPSRVIDASFDKLVIDSKRVRGLDLFRLAESVDTIVVSRSLKEFIESHNFWGVKFHESSSLAIL